MPRVEPDVTPSRRRRDLAGAGLVLTGGVLLLAAAAAVDWRLAVALLGCGLLAVGVVLGKE